MKRVFLFVIALLMFNSIVYASNIVDIEDSKQVVIEVSRKDLNMIKTNLPSPSVLTNSKNIEATVIGGNIYIGYIDAEEAKPEGIFITADTGESYSLVLVPKEIPSALIVLRATDIHYEEAKKDEKSDEEEKPEIVKKDYVSEIKDLIKSMYKGVEPSGYKYVKIGKQVEIWKGIELILIGMYVGSEWKGEVYSLTNKTGSTLKITPNDFYEEKVIGVSIDKAELVPGEATNIFIVRKNG